MTGKHKRIDLDSFLAEKLVDWYADPHEPDAVQLRKACELMTGFVANRPCGEVIAAGSPGGAVSRFKYALDDPSAWEKVERELNEMSQAELDEQGFPVLVHYLTLL